MCIIFATLTWPENPADAISEVLNSKISLGEHAPRPPKKACFRTLTFRTLRSTVYVALPVPEQLLYSGYATAERCILYILFLTVIKTAPLQIPTQMDPETFLLSVL